jgi:RNA polymerase sigma factor for flagellar operon FliA
MPLRRPSAISKRATGSWLTLYYYEEMTMKEIGLVLNITESRVSQIHSQAVLRLRGKLTERGLVQ